MSFAQAYRTNHGKPNSVWCFHEEQSTSWKRVVSDRRETQKVSEDTQSSEELTARKNLITSALGVEVWDYCLARKNWEKAHQENETLWLDYDDLEPPKCGRRSH